MLRLMLRGVHHHHPKDFRCISWDAHKTNSVDANFLKVSTPHHHLHLLLLLLFLFFFFFFFFCFSLFFYFYFLFFLFLHPYYLHCHLHSHHHHSVSISIFRFPPFIDFFVITSVAPHITSLDSFMYVIL